MRVQPSGWCLVGNDPPAIGNEPTKMGVTSGLQPLQPSGNQQEGRGAAKGRTRGFSGRSAGRDRVLILLISAYPVYPVWGEMACDNATSRQWPFLVHQKDQKDAAEKIGIAAVRYFDMKQPGPKGDRALRVFLSQLVQLRDYSAIFRNRTTDYVFNWDRMLDAKAAVEHGRRCEQSVFALDNVAPQGNSAVFLFYAYARIRVGALC